MIAATLCNTAAGKGIRWARGILVAIVRHDGGVRLRADRRASIFVDVDAAAVPLDALHRIDFE